jgi:hypothetical protein
MHRCKNAIKYKAVYKYRCSGGSGCELCREKYELAQHLRAICCVPVDFSGLDFVHIRGIAWKLNNAFIDIEEDARNQAQNDSKNRE